MHIIVGLAALLTDNIGLLDIGVWSEIATQNTIMILGQPAASPNPR